MTHELLAMCYYLIISVISFLKYKQNYNVLCHENEIIITVIKDNVLFFFYFKVFLLNFSMLIFYCFY